MSNRNRRQRIVNHRPRSEGRKQVRMLAKGALLEINELKQWVKDTVVSAHNQTAIELHALKEIVLATAHSHPERSIVLLGAEHSASLPIGLEPREFERRVAAVKARMLGNLDGCTIQFDEEACRAINALGAGASADQAQQAA